MLITFVSCFYIIKSKFHQNIYINWMNKFLKIVNNFYLVIFTDENSVKYIDTNNNNNIKIIIKPLEHFYTYKYYNYWIENHKQNYLLNEKSTHNTSWELNMLWSEKIFFINDVYNNKYFDTDFYGWCDIGYFRDLTEKDYDVFRLWPSNYKVENLAKDKIHYAIVNNIQYIGYLKKIINNKNDKGLPVNPIPADQVSIAGGFFIIYNKNIEWWRKTYYEKLDLYFKNNYLVKDDQIIIIDCILSNDMRFKLHTDFSNLNPWFVFQRLLLP